MIKIVKFSINEILLDSEAVSEAVNKACSRNPPAKVAGMMQVGETLMIPLEETKDVQEMEYVIVPFPAVNEDEFAGEIRARYYAGFSTIGVFSVTGKNWALYSKTDSNFRRKSDALLELAGSWEDGRSAEKIIGGVRKGRKNSGLLIRRCSKRG